MSGLTKRQQQVLDFVQQSQQSTGSAPTFREIARHFGFRSPRAASDHVAALCKKGFLSSESGMARSLRVVSPWQTFRKRVVDIPIFGSIPAGFGDRREQEATGCVSVDIATLNIKPSDRTFALQVRGDSMIGRHIVDGDMVVVEHGATPRDGNVVAALIDGESTLKTFVADRRKPYLKAENPKYPALVPVNDLVVQGVVVLVIRQLR
jgi:repressor LexA